MGHIRLGRIPRSKKWAGIFSALGGPSLLPDLLSREISICAQKELEELRCNEGVNYCYWMLVRILSSSHTQDFSARLQELGINTNNIESGAEFVRRISEVVSKEMRIRIASDIFTEMAALSLREILTQYIIEGSKSLFGTGLPEIQSACNKISSNKAFGEVSRDFFSKFTARYLKFIVDKEVSNYVGLAHTLSSPSSVNKFHEDLDRYCYETSLIVKGFAQGWFSKLNWQTGYDIAEQETKGFTAYALEKIQMELKESQK